MARRQKHEEHQNHERWVISYADMVTLLFALFVVLYALGQIDLEKLRQLKRSLAFAFHFEGSGKTQELGVHEKGDVGGDLIQAAPLMTAQRGPMIEFLRDTLPEEFRQITGKSLEVIQTDDTIAFKGQLSAFFPSRSKRLRARIDPWLKRLVQSSSKYVAWVRIRIHAPRRAIGTNPDGTAFLSGDLCLERLNYVHRLVSLMPGVAEEQIGLEFRYLPRSHPRRGSWEDTGTITFAFTNRVESF